jgi:hypothetical protein
MVGLGGRPEQSPGSWLGTLTSGRSTEVGNHRRRALALVPLVAFPLLGFQCALTAQPYQGPSAARKLYVDGDSITFGSTDALNAQFQPAYQVRIDGWSGNTTKGMLPEAQNAAPTGPDVAIIELGTNDPVHGLTLADSQNWLQQLNATFPPTTCVIFVTPWSGTAGRAAGTLEAIATYERQTFPHVADWDALTVPEDYAGGDGVHPVIPLGNQHLMQVYAAAIAGCPPPPSTTTTTDPSTTTSTDPTTTTTDPTTTTTDPTTTTSDPTTTTSTDASTTTATDSTTTATDASTTTDPSTTTTDSSTTSSPPSG